ncbi:MAG: glycerophosphodiester phosphodiesterase family protein [Tannerella sp.]|jgi:glycerophosphoryl diester phosphodiesterase|nr:glycerophosphodiester phosphodiesterase family protein [Tannerella sp.]
MMRIRKTVTIIFAASLFVSCGGSREGKATRHVIPCGTYADVEQYFRYTAGCRMIVSGHRGGNAPGFPENAIETFEYTLSYIESFFEIDPQMTKDSVIVLMHDETIDRTTTGTGKVADYTFDELQQFNLVDRWGNTTPFKIPSAENVIRWSQGKTILNFDKKSVTRDVLIPLVKKCGAENVIYTVHNAGDALFCYRIDNHAHFSAWIKDMDALREYDETGIPWSHFIAYVESATMNPDNQALYDALHERGVRCMIALSPSHDRLPSSEARIAKYREEIAKKPDIIETDYPVEFAGLYRLDKQKIIITD